MKTHQNTLVKKPARRMYKIPVIERIQIDNEISLALESDPPILEGEAGLIQEQYRINPYSNSNFA